MKLGTSIERRGRDEDDAWIGVCNRIPACEPRRTDKGRLSPRYSCAGG